MDAFMKRDALIRDAKQLNRQLKTLAGASVRAVLNRELPLWKAMLFHHLSAHLTMARPVTKKARSVLSKSPEQVRTGRDKLPERMQGR
jgi:hypothetical protein